MKQVQESIVCISALKASLASVLDFGAPATCIGACLCVPDCLTSMQCVGIKAKCSILVILGLCSCTTKRLACCLHLYNSILPSTKYECTASHGPLGSFITVLLPRHVRL